MTILKESGLTEDNLKKWLAGDPQLWASHSEDEKARKELHNRIRSRVSEGMDRNFRDYKLWYALDKAWDQPFQQITPTLVSRFIDTDPNSEDVYNQVQEWGLAHLISEETDQKTGKAIKRFNLPVFFNVFVPLVRAYVTIRWAKIMNDRRLTPFFKYDPVKQTTPLRLKCEAITDRVQIISEQYGYYDVMKQSVLKMLHYSLALQFVETEWDSVEQERIATEEDVLLKKTKPDPDNPGGRVPVNKGDKIKVTTREGLTYHTPHPSRTYVDIAHPKYTLNYGYGCKFAGHWRIVRYRDLISKSFWNKENIALGNADIMTAHQSFFNTVYGACTLKYGFCAPAPATPTGTVAAAEVGAGTSALDRESQIASQYFGHDRGDQGVLVIEHFEHIIPKDCGLGTYEHPVWFRFTLAGDGNTILYAAPVPYNPVIYYGLDADESREKNASLSLEIMPFQDHFSNVMTQIILTAKQNLANMALVDEDQLTESNISKVQNLGANAYVGLNIFGFSSRKAFRGQNRVADAVQSFNLPKGNVAELTNVLKTILDVLERVLVMSSHEVAQAASHEQTREEVRNIAQSTSTRLVFSATPVDIATAAWKRQIYQGLMAYGDDDMYMHIPSEIPLDQKALAAMGFTFVDKDEAVGNTDRYRTVMISKKATAIDMWQFASFRDGEDRVNDSQTAVAMSSIVRDMLNNPMTAQAIGPDQAIELANRIGQLAGLPRDFRLKNASPNQSAEQKQQEAQAQLKTVLDAVMGKVHEDMQGALEPLLKQTKDNIKAIGENKDAITEIMGALKQIGPVNPAMS